jgi:hypothetical protein
MIKYDKPHMFIDSFIPIQITAKHLILYRCIKTTFLAQLCNRLHITTLNWMIEERT